MSKSNGIVYELTIYNDNEDDEDNIKKLFYSCDQAYMYAYKIRDRILEEYHTYLQKMKLAGYQLILKERPRCKCSHGGGPGYKLQFHPLDEYSHSECGHVSKEEGLRLQSYFNEWNVRTRGSKLDPDHLEFICKGLFGLDGMGWSYKVEERDVF